MKPPFYREPGVLPTKDMFEKLSEAVDALEPHAPPELMRDLRTAVEEARVASTTRIPISKGSTRVGYGVSKADKAIACDNVVAIIRQIKAAKAW